MQENTKRGRGRPKGAVSFTEISVKSLSEQFGEDAVIPVGRIWLQNQKASKENAEKQSNEN